MIVNFHGRELENVGRCADLQLKLQGYLSADVIDALIEDSLDLEENKNQITDILLSTEKTVQDFADYVTDCYWNDSKVSWNNHRELTVLEKIENNNQVLEELEERLKDKDKPYDILYQLSEQGFIDEDIANEAKEDAKNSQRYSDIQYKIEELLADFEDLSKEEIKEKLIDMYDED